MAIFLADKTVMNTFFFSDPHFGHWNIIEYQDRPFRTTDEMDEAMIENWNRVVGKKDRVFLLGDVSLHKPEKTREILDRLHGCEPHGRLAPSREYTAVALEITSPRSDREAGSHSAVRLRTVNEQCPFCNVHGHTHRNKFELRSCMAAPACQRLRRVHRLHAHRLRGGPGYRQAAVAAV